MTKILTQAQRANAVRSLTFCYLCGQRFASGGRDWNRDHVPPVSYMSARDAALPMRAHPSCNSAWSVRDERAGQLVGTMIGRFPASVERTRIDVTRFANAADGQSFFGVLDFGLDQDVRRIVRAFHAALYGEYLPPQQIWVSLPFAAGNAPSGIPEIEPPPSWHAAAVIDLQRSRHVGRLDHLVCGKDECEYVCTRVSTPTRPWRCVFGLRLHTWGEFGDPAFGQRGCVGFYYSDRCPQGASRAPGIAVGVRIPNPLDPFAR